MEEAKHKAKAETACLEVEHTSLLLELRGGGGGVAKYEVSSIQSCDAPKLGGLLIIRQLEKYSWMLGNPTQLTKIGKSLLCTGSSTQGTKPVPIINNDHTESTCE